LAILEKNGLGLLEVIMEFKKLILFSLFLAFSASTVQLATANPAAEVAAQAVKVSLGQRIFDRTIGVNPYWVYSALHKSPLGPVLSTTILLGSLVGLRSLYQGYYNGRAERYKQIVDGLNQDFQSKLPNNKLQVDNAVAGLTMLGFKDRYLEAQVDKFYRALTSRIASTPSTTVRVAAGRAPAAAMHGGTSVTHASVLTTATDDPSVVLSAITDYLLGKNNFFL